MLTSEQLRFLFRYNLWADPPDTRCVRRAEHGTVHARSGFEFWIGARHGGASLRRRMVME